MRVLYVAPRYHNNQIPIMEGWLEDNNQVLFISQIASSGEDYSVLKPRVLGYSKVFDFIFKLRNYLKKCNDPDAKFAISSKKGFPSYFKLKRLITQFAPDVVILRERSFYNIVAYQICKRKKIPCILYNQSPLWGSEPLNNSMLHRIVRRNMPSFRITPVMGEPKCKQLRETNSYYVPFVIKPKMEFSVRKYCKDGILHLLCVGRYMECKNHILQLSTLKRLRLQYNNIHLTLVGEVTDDEQQKYYDGVISYIEENDLQPYTTVRKNVSHKEVYEEYSKADVFLLPSEEAATIVQLEAMACSLPVICSPFGGRNAHVRDGYNGYLVKIEEEDLAHKLEIILRDLSCVEEMGKNSLKFIQENCSFKNYKEQILKVIKDINEQPKKGM